MIFITRIIFVLSFLNFIILGTGGLQIVSVSNSNLVNITSGFQKDINSHQIYETNGRFDTNSEIPLLNLKEPDEISLSKTLRSSSFKEITFNYVLVKYSSEIFRKFSFNSESKYLLHQTFRL